MDEYALREELLKGEDSTRQFKRHLPDRYDFPKEIIAFLNTRGGRLIIGVEDDGSICGIPSADLGKTFDNAISNACTTGIRPACSVLTFNIRTDEGMVVVIEVPEGDDKPYQDSKGNFYVKRGADKRRVTERSEIRRLLSASPAIHSDTQAVPGTSFLDLNDDGVRTYYDSRFSGESLASLDNEDELLRQLRGIRLMNGDNLSLTGAMLFAKNPNALLPSFTINAIWFKGNEGDGTEYWDSRRLEGTLQAQFEKAMGFLNKWNSRIQTGSFNENGQEEIPSIVFEELLVNALVHRDYAIQDSVKLFIFDNRIEIRSPGCLPNSLTEEEALKGIGRDRNPQLESFAYDLMNYRGARSGLRRVKKHIPKFELHNNIEGEEVVVVIPV